jgi:hypothetical protein
MSLNKPDARYENHRVMTLFRLSWGLLLCSPFLLGYSVASAQTAKKSAATKPADKSCGQVIQLNQDGFKRLDLFKQLSHVVDNGGFTPKELTMMNHDDLLEQAFSAYSLAYLSWKTPLSHADIERAVQKGAHGVNRDDLSAEEKVQFDAWLPKLRAMMLKAFDLGLYDAKRNPCPF